MSDVRYRLDAARSNQTVEQTNRLLRAVSEIQLKFIRGSDSLAWWAEMLQTFLDVTDSEYGFIGNVDHDSDGTPSVRIQAIRNLAHDQESRAHDSSVAEGLALQDPNTLIGEFLRTGKLLISNNSEQDQRDVGLPEGGPGLTAIMVIPLRVNDKLIGIVGIANRPRGYDAELANWLNPLCATSATLIMATQDQRGRQVATEGRNFLTTKSPWKDSDGKIIGVIGVSRDLTEWKETQNALQESRERLQAIIENTPECVKLVARDGALLEMNAAGLQMIEADSAASVIGKSVFDLIAPEYRSLFVAFHDRVCDGESGSIQFEIVGLTGTRLWMETHAVPLSLSSENGTVHLAITRDITATRDAEETIAEQQSKFFTYHDCQAWGKWLPSSRMRSRSRWPQSQTLRQPAHYLHNSLPLIIRGLANILSRLRSSRLVRERFLAASVIS
jgi:PAS domain S-box-containing protein